MPRPPRPRLAGAIYHVTARGVARRSIFEDDDDRLVLTRLLDRVVVERRWEVHTACFMPNHVHVVVRTPEADISEGMQRVLGEHARHFNLRHERTGHLFQGRFHTQLVKRDLHHLELFRYVARNPVRAGICDHPSAFAWSTHAVLAGEVEPPAFLSFAGVQQAFAGPAAYRDFVLAERCETDLVATLLGDGSVGRIRLALDAGATLSDVGRRLRLAPSTILRRLEQAGLRKEGV